jgi:hypothetical protein
MPVGAHHCHTAQIGIKFTEGHGVEQDWPQEIRWVPMPLSGEFQLGQRVAAWSYGCSADQKHESIALIDG